MKVFLDGRMLYQSGIGRYIRNIVHTTLGSDDSLEYLIAGDLKEIERCQEQEFLSCHRAAIKAIPYEQRIYTLGEQMVGSRLVKTNDQCDLFFFPHYNAPYYLPANSVVTVHDLIHFRLAERFERSKVLLARQVLKNAIKKAGKIITVSKSTSQDLQEMFPGLDREKIKVVYHGVGNQFSKALADEIDEYKKKRGLTEYILYIGNRKPHKNLGRLVEAYAGIIKDIPGLQLVIAGKRFAAIDEVDLLRKKYQLKNLVELKDLSDDELRLLYSGADALVLPSLYEGFGLPVLEAMNCNVPVVLSNTSSLPEIAGDAGIYFDPYNIEDMGRQIYSILTDGSLQNRLKKAGIKQAGKFTWHKAAEETLRIFNQIIDPLGRSI